MAAIATALGSPIVGIGGIYLAQPLRRFYDLREDCRAQMLYFANVGVPKTGESDDAFKDHQRTLRQLGTRMLAFANTRSIAVFVLELQGSSTRQRLD